MLIPYLHLTACYFFQIWNFCTAIKNYSQDPEVLFAGKNPRDLTLTSRRFGSRSLIQSIQPSSVMIAINDLKLQVEKIQIHMGVDF